MSKRPAKSVYHSPTQQFNVRLLPGDRALMEETARQAGVSLAEWARRVLLRAAGLPVEGAAMRKGWPLGRPRKPLAAPQGVDTAPDGPTAA